MTKEKKNDAIIIEDHENYFTLSEMAECWDQAIKSIRKQIGCDNISRHVYIQDSLKFIDYIYEKHNIIKKSNFQSQKQ